MEQKENLVLCIGGPLDGTFVRHLKCAPFFTAPWPTNSSAVPYTDANANYEEKVFKESLYKLEFLRSKMREIDFYDYKVYVCQDGELDIIEELIKGYRRAI